MIRTLSRPLTGIRFGDYVFTEPIPLDRLFLPPHSTGVYAILIPDPTWGPRDFQPLFFGEFAHGRYSITAAELSLSYRAAAGKSLYIAVLGIPEAHAGDLASLKQKLIYAYRPICNRDDGSDMAIETARRLEQLERRTYEQELHLKLMLAALGQMMPQPLVETKKKPAGFMSRD
jgi:hypothetical protein